MKPKSWKNVVGHRRTNTVKMDTTLNTLQLQLGENHGNNQQINVGIMDKLHGAINTCFLSAKQGRADTRTLGQREKRQPNNTSQVQITGKWKKGEKK